VSGRSPALQVVGARTLRASLKQAGLDVQDLKDAHKAVAELVRRESQPRAPRRTGRLAASERASGTQSAAIVRAGSARLPYGPPIHWGWEAHHIAAQPWIYETAQATEPTWAGTYLHALETIINHIEGAPNP
jgi:hypothetical protein